LQFTLQEQTPQLGIIDIKNMFTKWNPLEISFPNGPLNGSANLFGSQIWLVAGLSLGLSS
ncbi:hypothetical protein DVA76_19790, partial [Acinetobacter baumannii]